MSFIQFESATEKEKIRQELRNAREELLLRAKKNAEDRAKAEAEKKLRGENSWILPSLNEKLERQSASAKKSKKSKKSSKEKRSKREKKKAKKRKNEKKDSKKKKSRQKSPSEESSDSESDSSDSSRGENEWVEKKVDIPAESEEPLKRDDWMTGSFLLPTYSKRQEKNEQEKPGIDSYDPAKSSRELNPYWKDGGTGLPTFRKPKEDDDGHSRNYPSQHRQPSGNWRKKRVSPKKGSTGISEERPKRRGYSPKRSSSRSPEHISVPKHPQKSDSSEGTSSFLTDQQMNELGAKLVKAEIMGNEELAKELKDKLEKARNVRNKVKDNVVVEPTQKPQKEESEHVLLTTTDSKGVTRPLPSRSFLPSDPYSKKDGKRKKVETHEEGKRIKYFPDDDRYDIKQMFEREKYATARDSDEQFINIAGKQKNTKDDLEDIFADNVRKEISEHEADEKERRRAIQEHERFSRTLDTCDKCFDSPKMEKHLLVAMGTTAYLSLPWHEGLHTGHCMIIPVQHVSCSTQLDEDTWAEINEFRKALTRMFAARSMDVIFFEIARYLNRTPHMVIHCVPSKNFEMAPFYFKKAIQESEQMWATNKQLISLSGKDVRRAVPKGLPYFWVHFGMDSGFAHVIEDQQQFPVNFAQEIIGGMLELDARMWRKPRKEHNSMQKVKQFADWWKPYDCTT